MPKVTEAHIEARRNQILLAAATCFSRKGFHQTTIRDICQEAALSAGAVYGYFKGKEEIIDAIAEMGRRNTRDFLESARSSDSAPQALAEMLGAAIDLLVSEDACEGNRLNVRLWGEALNTDRIRTIFIRSLADLTESLAAEVRRGQERGEIASHLDPDSAAQVFAAIGLGFNVQAAMDPGADFGGSSDVVSALLTGAFGGPGAGQ